MNLTPTFSVEDRVVGFTADHHPGLFYILSTNDVPHVDRRIRLSAKRVKALSLKVPVTVNKRWWAEIHRYAAPMTEVRIMQFYDSTEVNLPKAQSSWCIAVFKSPKHAKEFCQLNHLRASYNQ